MTVLDSFSLVGRTALLTGGSRGIGRAVARALGEAGARVAVTATTAGGGPHAPPPPPAGRPHPPRELVEHKPPLEVEQIQLGAPPPP
ncbi:SDR family NAD(P)-dependent oxidoreductase, partial [Cellulosimicrobium funkei]|uniref:SDR family NAD(P)-dependent oxidoreductase n=1 Tax=Cellulosimicrobium funkei TaxID=264251 RepID=UPI003758299F